MALTEALAWVWGGEIADYTVNCRRDCCHMCIVVVMPSFQLDIRNFNILCVYKYWSWMIFCRQNLFVNFPKHKQFNKYIEVTQCFILLETKMICKLNSACNPQQPSHHQTLKMIVPPFLQNLSGTIFCWLQKNIPGKRKEQKWFSQQKYQIHWAGAEKSQLPRPKFERWAPSIEVMQAVYNEPFLFLSDNKALTSIVFPLLIIKKRRPTQTRARSRQSELQNVKYFSPRNFFKPKYYVSR